MSDLIERDKAIEAIRKLPNAGTRWIVSAESVFKVLMQLPSARPKGEWMPIIEANEFGETYQAGIYCSECGETLGCEANFCPNCGARMKGADDE